MQTERYRCPYDYCPVLADEPDDIAVHLIDRHGLDYDKARIWLKEKVEIGLERCQCEECRWMDAEELKRGARLDR